MALILLDECTPSEISHDRQISIAAGRLNELARIVVDGHTAYLVARAASSQSFVL